MMDENIYPTIENNADEPEPLVKENDPELDCLLSDLGSGYAFDRYIAEVI